MKRTHDVIVIGAGQAGLATGYWLTRAGARFAILEAGPRPGGSWRAYWRSLRLFSPTCLDHLPGFELDGEPWSFPTKDQTADYLDAYARRFELPVITGARVHRVRRDSGCFELNTSAGSFAAEQIVVATGSHVRPYVPAWASQLDATIVQRTAREYVSPAALPPGDVLVVGAGNSGVQIAMELAATRPTYLAGRDTGYLPRRLLHRDVAFWADHFGILRVDVDSRLGRLAVSRVGQRGFPVVGITRAEIAASGVERMPKLTGTVDGRPQVADGRVLDVRSLVWCCGLSPDLRFIEGLSTDARGYPRHERGRSTEIDGLHFMGLRFQCRLGSDLLGGVGRDAEEVVTRLVGARRRAA